MELIKKTKMPIPRCPLCDAILEEAQLIFKDGMWHECWGCDSCHTMHMFPARLDFLEFVKGSQNRPGSTQMPTSVGRALFLPKGVDKGPAAPKETNYAK